MDAHSMLLAAGGDCEAVRFSTSDSLEEYVAGMPVKRIEVSRQGALEEEFFLGLRLHRGVDLDQVRVRFGSFVATELSPLLVDLSSVGLIDWEGDRVRLTAKGRLLSNEVFEPAAPPTR